LSHGRGRTLDWLVPLLVCPRCRTRLELEEDAPGQGVLRHASGSQCGLVYPVIDEIPRLVTGSARAALLRHRREWFTKAPARADLRRHWTAAEAPSADHVVAGFDFEWKTFSHVGSPELGEVFGLYFDQVHPAMFDDHRIVLDGGCGAGRWAYEVARRGPRVVAVDLGMSIEVARRNTASTSRVALVQADLREMPFAPAAFDWAYSLGVLHHLNEPNRALSRLVEATAPGGIVLLYLYYALDNRGFAYRLLFRGVDLTRRLSSRTPRSVTLVLATAIATIVYWPLARASALAARFGLVGLADALPLSFYRERSFRTMRNDSLDRFGTRLERRFSRRQMIQLMEAAGLADVRISPNVPYWHGIGRRRPAH